MLPVIERPIPKEKHHERKHSRKLHEGLLVYPDDHKKVVVSLLRPGDKSWLYLVDGTFTTNGKKRKIEFRSAFNLLTEEEADALILRVPRYFEYAVRRVVIGKKALFLSPKKTGFGECLPRKIKIPTPIQPVLPTLNDFDRFLDYFDQFSKNKKTEFPGTADNQEKAKTECIEAIRESQKSPGWWMDVTCPVCKSLVNYPCYKTVEGQKIWFTKPHLERCREGYINDLPNIQREAVFCKRFKDSFITKECVDPSLDVLHAEELALMEMNTSSGQYPGFVVSGRFQDKKGSLSLEWPTVDFELVLLQIAKWHSRIGESIQPLGVLVSVSISFAGLSLEDGIPNEWSEVRIRDILAAGLFPELDCREGFGFSFS